MYANELRKKPVEELSEILKSESKKLEELQMQLLKQKEKNFNKVKFGRRDIARIKTVLREKMMEEKVAPEIEVVETKEIKTTKATKTKKTTKKVKKEEKDVEEKN
jgi:large subunit ribosomal protein L29